MATDASSFTGFEKTLLVIAPERDRRCINKFVKLGIHLRTSEIDIFFNNCTSYCVNVVEF